MFHLLSAIWQSYFAVEEYKILVIGPDGAGKTTLLESLKTKYTDRPGLPRKNILPTVGLNIARVKAHSVNLLLWDLGGRRALRPIWSKYYKICHGVVLVVDGSVPETNQDQWSDARVCLREILRHPLLARTPLLILENKLDLGSLPEGTPSLLRLEEVFTEADASTPPVQTDTKVCQTSGFGQWCYRVVRVSAATGEGVDDALEWLCGIVTLNRRLIDAD